MRWLADFVITVIFCIGLAVVLTYGIDPAAVWILHVLNRAFHALVG